MTTDTTHDKKYVNCLLTPLKVCARYKPAFGKGKSGTSGTAKSFADYYGADPLYHWLGLDSKLMYAAHKAAGGMTSIYRQLGMGCEGLFGEIVMDALGLDKTQAAWGYDIEKKDGTKGHLSLDARIDSQHVRKADEQRVCTWLSDVSKALHIKPNKVKITGAVFEVRQGYKSADSKRQNADIRSGMHALGEGYAPVMAVFSTQVSESVVRRYRNSNILVLTGTVKGTPLDSTFKFSEQVLNYPLAGFFERNHEQLRREFTRVLEALLSAE